MGCTVVKIILSVFKDDARKLNQSTCLYFQYFYKTLNGNFERRVNCNAIKFLSQHISSVTANLQSKVTVVSLTDQLSGTQLTIHPLCDESSSPA